MKIRAIFLMLSFLPLFSSAQQVKTPSKLFELVSPSVVTIFADGKKGISQGSAVVYASNSANIDLNLPGSSTLMTNAHVVGSNSEVKVKVAGVEYRGEVLGIDDSLDLAIVNVKNLVLPAVKIVNAVPRIGSNVYAIGSPLGLEKSLTSGLVSNIREKETLTFIQSTAAISPGSSGGGLFDDKGGLIGVTTSKLNSGEALGFSISTKHFDAMIDASFAASALELAATRWPDNFKVDSKLLGPTTGFQKWLRQTFDKDNRPLYVTAEEVSDIVFDSKNRNNKVVLEENLRRLVLIVQKFVGDTSAVKSVNLNQSEIIVLECDEKFNHSRYSPDDRRRTIYKVDLGSNTINGQSAKISEETFLLERNNLRTAISRLSGQLEISLLRDDGERKAGRLIVTGTCTKAVSKLF